MPNVNFYLKKPKVEGKKIHKDAETLIFLQFKYPRKNRFVYFFNQKIQTQNWNEKKQRVNSNKATTRDGQHSINYLLDNLSKLVIKVYNSSIAAGKIPTKDIFKKTLDTFIYQASDEVTERDSLFSLFDRFISGEIKNRAKDKSKNTLQNYTTAKNHLLAYATYSKQKIDFDDITLDFFYKFVNYLMKDIKKQNGTKGLKRNTIAKDITILKTVMAEAVDLGYTMNMQFKHKKFSISEEETDSVYLTEKEVIKLYQHDFSCNRKLEQVRDLFVVGCFTGLRYSDYSNILPENIIETDGDLFVKMITQKTKDLVIIPCNPIVLEIFKKYESNPNRLPRTVSSQKFNDYIKEAVEEAGLTETGRLSTDPTKHLWECITSHTARRSFATNLYLEGFPSHELMKITGHRSEASFKKYIKVTQLQTAKRLSEHIKKNWSSKLLKVA